ncbi:MAG: hypothetical protein ACOYM3_20625 [Terrimicrobiaceae bacterium]
MEEAVPLVFTVESAEFFSVGRALQRGFGKRAIGEVTLAVRNKVLSIDCDSGGGQMASEGEGEISAWLKASAFCTLITSRFREKAPVGPMKLVFRPGIREVAIAGAGVKARY